MPHANASNEKSFERIPFAFTIPFVDSFQMLNDLWQTWPGSLGTCLLWLTPLV